MNHLTRILILLTVFSIAMGFMESAIVIYLRELYYPNGFDFPLSPVSQSISLVEFAREAATIIMLAIIGILAGKNTAERFSFFLFCFAVWDIFYYVFLYVVLQWPSSLLTWDALFFIPVLWVGPVLAPCIASLTMILLTLAVVYFHQRDRMVTISRIEWWLLVLGSLVMIISFTMEFVQYIYTTPGIVATTQDYILLSGKFVPQYFNWWVFGLGEGMILAGIFSLIKRHLRKPAPAIHI